LEIFKVEPNLRPSTHGLINHKFFGGDRDLWQKVKSKSLPVPFEPELN